MVLSKSLGFCLNFLTSLRSERGKSQLLFTLAADSPGYVTVKVHSLQGQYLGETPFHYEDEVEDLLQLLIRDCKLQARYFRLLAQELGNRTSETEKKTSEPSSFTNTGMILAHY